MPVVMAQRRNAVNLELILVGLVAFGLLVYLVYTLLFPERF